VNETGERVAPSGAKIDGVLLIDANQYLDLYRTGTGKKLLAPLKEQEDHIFLTATVAEEVQRRKVEVAASFLVAEFKKLELRKFSVPDHLFGTAGQGMQERLQAIRSNVEAASEELLRLAHDLLGQISRSEDEVSKALEGIFAKAVRHAPDEILRARERKDRGNAPGKGDGPLGDQLSWEQILNQCKDKSRLWIITRDGDYATSYGGKLFLNAALYKNLAELRQPATDVRCYDNIPDGIKDFADTVHVKAEKLPSPEETEQIKKEQEALPRLDWMTWGTESTFRKDTRLTPGTGILRFNYDV
jgi:hypothetical protein